MIEKESFQSSQNRRYLFYGFIVVAAALLIIMLDYGARLSFGVFFKPMLNEFGWTRALTSGSVTLSMLFQGMGAIMIIRYNRHLKTLIDNVMRVSYIYVRL